MIVPEGFTEDEVVLVVDGVLDRIAPGFAVGFHSVEDMKQYGWEEVLKLFARGRYDPSMPLENWVCRCVRNRFLNLHRNHVRRPGPPCDKCHEKDYCGGGVPCDVYRDWRDRNAAKRSLALSFPILACPSGGLSPEEAFRLQEASENIDDLIPPLLRPFWLQHKAGLKVPQRAMAALTEAVREAW